MVAPSAEHEGFVALLSDPSVYHLLETYTALRGEMWWDPTAGDQLEEALHVTRSLYWQGRAPTAEAILCIEQEARRAGGDYHFFRYEGVDPAGCATTKQDFLDYVATIKPGPQGFTAYLDGHGDALGTSLAGHQAFRLDLRGNNAPPMRIGDLYEGGQKMRVNPPVFVPTAAPTPDGRPAPDSSVRL